MTTPRSSSGAAPVDRLVVGALAAVVLIGCIAAGRTFTGVLGAAGLWFGARWLIVRAIAQKEAALAEDAAGPATVSDDLVPILAALERSRLEMLPIIARRMRTRLPVGLSAGVLLWLWMQFGSDPPGLLVLAIAASIGAVAGWAWAVGQLADRYRARYKAEVLPRLAAGMGDLSYRQAVPPDARLIREQKLFPRFDRLSAEDEIFGTCHGVPVTIVELRLVDTGGDDDRTVFDGLFVRISLPRTLSGVTAVVADAGVLGSLRDLLGKQGASRVRVEDPEFERAYQVYATDQISARALLTPAFMGRFLALGELPGSLRPLALAQGNDLTVAVAKRNGGDLFEPPRFDRTADSRAALARLHGDIKAVLDVAGAVIDLDQSVRARHRAAASE